MAQRHWRARSPTCLFLRSAYGYPLDRGVWQSTIGAMGFNRRKLETERKAMIMGERTRYKLQCLCGNTGWAEWSDNDPVVDVSPGFSWAKGAKAFYAFYGGTLSCLRCGAEPTATPGR